MIPFADGHTHSVPVREDIAALVNLSFPEKPERIGDGNNLFFSAGIHPAKTRDADFNALEAYVCENNCRAIGECGLDRSIDIPFEEQKALFIRHLQLAERLRLPLVIHCVRAFYDLIAVKKNFEKNAVPWLVHGFRGNDKIAAALQEHGCILSLAPTYVCHMEKFPAFLRENSFLLETDDGKESIESLYEKAARAGGWETEELKERLYKVFRRLTEAVPTAPQGSRS